MLPVHQQQAARALARQLRHAAPSLLVAKHKNQSSTTSSRQSILKDWPSIAAVRASSAPAPAAAAATSDIPGVLPDEQGSLPHVSVLLKEVLDHLNHIPIKVYVDCTLGAGGHMAAMIQQHPELVVAAGIDVDPAAHEIAAARLSRLCNVLNISPIIHQLQGNFSEVVPLLSSCPPAPSSSSSSGSSALSLVGQVDAMLMDLGVSSMQFDNADRGFSFMHDGPIDMRMGPAAAAAAAASAEEIVNCASEAELGRILRDYGEEKSWKAVARRIVAAREHNPIKTTKQLVDIIGQTQIRGSSSSSSSSRKGKGIHPATRTFQALRIAVNDEIRKLEQSLPAALSCLSPGGRLAVISFHSLEDRIVKHAFMLAAGKPTPAQEALIHGPSGAALLDSLAAAKQGIIVTRKPVLPSDDEIAANPRSRSAKLRVFEKAGGPAAAAAAVKKGSKRRRTVDRELEK